MLGDHWGYGYDSLLIDLERWSESDYVSIDSIGASVQNRTLWELTITGPDSTAIENKKLVYIHARTHPNETEGWWVTDELIKILLSESELARGIRDSITFHIIPMYNPDGVELEYSRQNANGVDIESNWYATIIEPEVLALRSRFETLMNSNTSIDIALNMHSSYNGKRFFVCHDSTGTSPVYLEDEQRFITDVRSHFLHGIEPWDYVVTWTTGTAIRYPESWFWLNHADSVMALTYEDVNGVSASAFDTTASALLKGIFNYLDFSTTAVSYEDAFLPDGVILKQNYPNPFNPVTTIKYDLPTSMEVTLSIVDLNGRHVLTMVREYQAAGQYTTQWNGKNESGEPVSTGMYLCRLQAGSNSQTMKMVYLK